MEVPHLPIFEVQSRRTTPFGPRREGIPGKECRSNGGSARSAGKKSKFSEKSADGMNSRTGILTYPKRTMFRRILTSSLLVTLFLGVFWANGAYAIESRPHKNVKSYVKAKVFRTSYQLERNRYGNWRGRVQGDGRTHVFLRFFQNGRLVGRRLIGRVKLDNEPAGVLFSYRGSIPTQKHLKWDIVAFSEKL